MNMQFLEDASRCRGIVRLSSPAQPRYSKWQSRNNLTVKLEIYNLHLCISLEILIYDIGFTFMWIM